MRIAQCWSQRWADTCWSQRWAASVATPEVLGCCRSRTSRGLSAEAKNDNIGNDFVCLFGLCLCVLVIFCLCIWLIVRLFVAHYLIKLWPFLLSLLFACWPATAQQLVGGTCAVCYLFEWFGCCVWLSLFI